MSVLLLGACSSAPTQPEGDSSTSVEQSAKSTKQAQGAPQQKKPAAKKATKQTPTEEKLKLSNQGLGVSFDYPVFLLGAFDFDHQGRAAQAQSRRFYLLNRRQSIDDIDRIFSQSTTPGALLLERRPEGDNLHVLFYDTALVPRRVLKVALNRKMTSSKPGFTLMRGVEVLWDERYSQQAIIRITVLPFNPRSIQPGTPRTTTYHYQQSQGQYKPTKRR
ncbi:hypothetical protein [Maricurvus nonylphenolicus]|uniref:hypothetical protein n=1 Tax=Maricurvus nonylphenolicus TaxID=1008307 RepID=UPI0036F1D600